MPDQAPNIDVKPGDKGRLVYDKARRTIVAEQSANDVSDIETEAFERGINAGKHEASLETEYGSFIGHVQAVFLEARKLRDALEGDKLVDGLGAALSAYDDFMRAIARS